MVNCFSGPTSSKKTPVHFKSSCIMTRWSFATLLAVKPKNTSWVRSIFARALITFTKTHTLSFPLGLVYYLLGNLDPKLRSSLKNIQLLCVARNPIIVKYGIEEILKPIVESIQALEKVHVHKLVL